MREETPKAVLTALKPGQISLLWETTHLNRAPIGVHVACQPPKGVKRDDIGPGTTIPSGAPFVASVWARRFDWKKRAEVRFTEDGDCSKIDWRWLDAKQTLPILLLRFGVGDVGEWLAFAFVRGLPNAPVVQKFSFAENSSLDLDGRDARGFWQVRDTWTDDKGARWAALWRWNGKKFVQTRPKQVK